MQLGGRTGVEGPGLSKWQRGLWGLGTVFMQYAWARLDQIAAAQHWGDADSTPALQRAWMALRSCETALNVASLLNFVVFLQQGKYRQVPIHCHVCIMHTSNTCSQPRTLLYVLCDELNSIVCAVM